MKRSRASHNLDNLLSSTMQMIIMMITALIPSRRTEDSLIQRYDTILGEKKMLRLKGATTTKDAISVTILLRVYSTVKEPVKY